MTDNNNEAVVSSSNGDFRVDRRTGVVLSCTPGSENENIFQVDLDEFYSHYTNYEPGSVRCFDILDVGLWFVTETGTVSYDEPQQDWREETAQCTWEDRYEWQQHIPLFQWKRGWCITKEEVTDGHR